MTVGPDLDNEHAPFQLPECKGVNVFTFGSNRNNEERLFKTINDIRGIFSYIHIIFIFELNKEELN